MPKCARVVTAVCCFVLLAACSLTTANSAAVGTGTSTNDDIPPYAVILPPGYDQDTARYAVIYCLDGPSMVADGGCRVQQKLRELVAAGLVRDAIVVSLPAPNNRSKAYVPFADASIPELNEGGIGAGAYAAYIATVVGAIDARYRTKAYANARAVFGISYSGLFATWLAVAQPGLFGMVAALSPSYWVNNYQIFNDMQGLSNQPLVHYFDIGTREWNYYTPLLGVLQARGVHHAQHSFYHEVRYADHTFSSWGARIHVPLLIFLGDRSSTPTSMLVHIQVIRSASSSNLFQRINPVVTLANGIQYSPNQFATFEVVAGTGGTVTSDGRFALNGTATMQVRVRYLHFDQTVTIEASRINDYLDN